MFLNSFDYSKNLSLYIHVPFCISKCSYCSFYSETSCSSSIKDKYTERLVKEIEEVNARLNTPYYTAFIGGGNPGTLGVKNLEKIAKAICQNSRPLEFSIEMNPESLCEEYFPLFDSYFNRLSMGVQSLDEKALSFLGRNADLNMTKNGLALSQKLKEQTGCAISYDLITCLGSWHNELSDVKALVENYDIDHLSVYALTLEKGTPLFNKNPKLPDDDQQYEILKKIWKYLDKHGYEHYEVSNFAKKNKRCIHNCTYWAYNQYLGLGPGSSSTAFSKTGKVRRFSFKSDVNSYVNGKLFTGFKTEELSKIEAIEELIFMGLRYKDGLDLKRLKKMSKIDVKEVIKPSFGFDISNDHLVPNEDGLMLSDAKALEIIRELWTYEI